MPNSSLKLRTMSFKNIKSLKSKILLLIIWLAVYTVSILVINMLFRIPEEKLTKYSNRLEIIENDIIQLQAIKSDFLVQYQREGKSIALTGDPLDHKADTIIQKVFNEIHYLADAVPRFHKDSILRNLHASFSGSFSTYATNIYDLFQFVRERGNLNTGLISQWLNLSNGMFVSSANENVYANNIFLQIKQLEIKYLQGYETNYLEDLADTLTIIMNSIAFEDYEISRDNINNYIILTNKLIEINKRIQISNDAGLIPQVNHTFSNTLNDCMQLSSAYKQSIDRSIFISRLAGYLLILALFFIGLFWLLKISHKLIIKPLEKTMNYVDEVSRGLLPDMLLEVKTENEFETISEKLNRLVNNLKEKFNFIKALNESNFNVSLSQIDEQDILGNELVEIRKKIIETSEEQAKNNEENMRRRYINEGLAKFAEILRTNNNDIKVLGDIFIQNTVKYLNAIQGGLFLLNDSDEEKPSLSLVASFAYDRKKYLEKTIEVGEGLVGMCAVEKNTINLTEIPEGYISITSGLGDTPPDNLLLVPVIHENIIIGVIEIASLKKFQDFEITFTNEVAKSLAATIIYTRNTEQTNKLLAKSQQQALEMTEQEEEMRQNMEELKATQEESARREEEYKGIVDAIENSMFIIEYDLQGFISNANEKLCIFLGKRLDEITGKTHFQVFNGTLNPDEKFWNMLREKTALTKEDTVKTGKKKELLKEHFAAIYNINGVHTKFMNFALKIS